MVYIDKMTNSKKYKENRRFDEMYEHFLDVLVNEENDHYLELDKSKELKYMRFHKYRFKTIFQSIPSSRESIKILDMGTTPFTFFIKKCYNHYDVATIDLTDLMKQRCERNKVTFKKCNLIENSIPFEDDYFDIVIFTELFEHLFIHPSKVLSDISRVLKREGVLIFGTPNHAALYKRIKLLIGINPNEPIEEQAKEDWVHGCGHVREYTMKECIRILRINDFIIKEKKYDACWDRLVRLEWIENPKRFLLIFPIFVYDLICLLTPPFRNNIYIVCANNKKM